MEIDIVLHLRGTKWEPLLSSKKETMGSKFQVRSKINRCDLCQWGEGHNDQSLGIAESLLSEWQPAISKTNLWSVVRVFLPKVRLLKYTKIQWPWCIFDLLFNQPELLRTHIPWHLLPWQHQYSWPSGPDAAPAQKRVVWKYHVQVSGLMAGTIQRVCETTCQKSG